MFNEVLVGVDGGQGGRDAIALAQRLATRDGHLTLAHIYGGPTAGGRAAALAMPLEVESAEALLQTAANGSSPPVSTRTVFESSIGRGLHELAGELAADLLVVGSCRRALLGRATLGDDTRAALDGSPCAVAVAPRGYAESDPELNTVGVGYDGSPQSERALQTARQVARDTGARIRVLQVVSLQDVREERPIPADWPKTAEALVERCRTDLGRLDGVDGDAAYGGPREELQRFSRGVDLLVVGSRGYGPMDRLFHGSVSRYLLGHVACPLLVLPRSAADEPAEPAEARAQTVA